MRHRRILIFEGRQLRLWSWSHEPKLTQIELTGDAPPGNRSLVLAEAELTELALALPGRLGHQHEAGPAKK